MNQTPQENSGQDEIKTEAKGDPNRNRYQPLPSSGLEDEGGSKKSSNASTIIISVVASILVIMLMNWFVVPLVGKGTYEADITRLENDLVAMRAVDSSHGTDIAELSTAVGQQEDLIEESISGKVTEIENSLTTINNNLNNYALKSDLTVSLSPLSSDLQNLKSTVTTLQTSLDSLISEDLQTTIAAQGIDIADINDRLDQILTAISAIEERLDDLETVQTIPGQAVDLELTQSSVYLYPTDDSSNTTENDNSLLVGMFRITLTNNTNNEISDVIVNILVSTAQIQHIIGIPTLTSVPTMAWYNTSSQQFYYQYSNSWGLDLSAGQTKTLYFTFTIKGNTAYTAQYGYTYTVDAIVS